MSIHCMTVPPNSVVPGATLAEGLQTALEAALARVDPATAARLALVVGNDNYQQATPLNNARNDAQSLARELEAAGVNLLNTDQAAHGYRIEAAGLPGLRVPESQPLVVPGTERASFTVHVALPADAVATQRGQAHAIQLQVQRDDGVRLATKASFFVPR